MEDRGVHIFNAIALLQELGFTEQEARAYQALLQHHPVMGYELAKVSGIPRPNIYPVLQKLEAGGAALRVTGDETVRYNPVAPEEFLQRIEDQFQTTRRAAAASLQQLAHPAAAACEYDRLVHPAGHDIGCAAGRRR